MFKILVFFAFIAFPSGAAWPPSSSESTRGEFAHFEFEKLQTIYPNNINCRDFEMTDYKVWRLRSRSYVDLGNWDGAFRISGAISRGLFVRKGFDLLDVLEAKCGKSA
jgi:hypothetical protein